MQRTIRELRAVPLQAGRIALLALSPRFLTEQTSSEPFLCCIQHSRGESRNE
jgi:hypothetical protein